MRAALLTRACDVCPGEKPFECELCHKRFSRRDKLNMHSRSHTGEKPHKCTYCSYAAADSSSLKKHLRIHYDERPFKCQICPYASRNSSQLTVHLRSHTGGCSSRHTQWAWLEGCCSFGLALELILLIKESLSNQMTNSEHACL